MNNHYGFLLVYNILLIAGSPANSAILSGTVIDATSGEPVPRATIRVMGTGKSMLANEAGRFRLRLNPGTYELKFSHVAHYSEVRTLVLPDTGISTEIALTPSVIEVPGLRVYERAYDPAQQIILQAIARKEALLSRIQAYSFDAYTKLVVRDTSKDDSSSIMALIESQLASKWEYPDKYKEVIYARRQSSNLEDVEVLAWIGELTDFNRNRIDFGPYSVVSPTAMDALEHYNYYLLDTLYIDSLPVFRLEIEPKSDLEPLFTGTMDIADSTFGVVGIDVGFNSAFDFQFIVNPRYRQNYAYFENDIWMPIEIGFDGLVDISLPGIPVMAVSYVAVLHNFSFNTTHPKGSFDQVWFEITEDADKVDSATWQAGQLIPLTALERRGYERIDSIHNAPSPLHRKALRAGLGIVYLSLGGNPDIFHYNRVEGAYLGAAATLDKLVPRTEFRLKTGYAYDGEYWQHRYGIQYAVSENPLLTAGVRYHDQIVKRPTLISGSRADATSLAILDKTDPFDYYLEKGFTYGVQFKPWQNLSVSAALRDYNQYSATNRTDFSLWPGDNDPRLNPAIRDGKLRSAAASVTYDTRPLYRYKGKVRPLPVSSFTRLTASGELASPDLIENDFDFARYQFRVFRRQRLLNLGTTSLWIEGGASDRTLPPQRYFSVDFGAGILEHDFYFKTLGSNNFSGTRALAVYARHDFERILFRRTRLPLIEDLPFSLEVHGGLFWTDFSGHSLQPGDHELRSAEKPYGELGFSLGRISPIGLKVNFTWQLSSYATNRFTLSIGGGDLF